MIKEEYDFLHTDDCGNPFLKQWVEEFGELPIHVQIHRAKKLRKYENV